ncbi:hypothetical protein Hanom_Chr10g00889551 [Helianthus anomalus]
MNKHVSHTGRGGWDLIEKKKHIILPQLESVYKEIKIIQNSRSKLYLAGRAKYNIETQLYKLENDAYLEARNLSHTECELLMNMAHRLETMAYGMAWPSTSTMIDSSPIYEGCVKVEVDDIVDKHKKSEVYSVTKTSEIKLVEDLVLRYVQWPRYAIRIDEDDHQLPSQLQMEDQDLFKDGFVNMLASMEQQQTATNAPIQVSEPVTVPEPVPKLVPTPAPKPVPVLKPKSIPKPKKVRKSKLVPKPVSAPVPKPVLATVPKPKLERHIKLITGSEGETWEDPNLN